MQAKCDVMAFRKVLEENLLDAIFDDLSDEDDCDFDCDNEIHAFLGVQIGRIVGRVDKPNGRGRGHARRAMLTPGDTPSSTITAKNSHLEAVSDN